MLCPYCKTELEKREDGSYECPNCKTKIKPLASEQTAEKADDKSQGEANEVEQLKKRIATLEENSLQSKVKKAAGAATTYVKGNWKWLLPVVLAVLLFIILMVSFVGLRGIYVNVNDPNDFMDFGVSKYTAYSTDELGQAYVESGKYTLSGSKLTLKVKDSDFGDLKEEFAVRVSTGYNSLKLILDGDEVIEYKRVSIVGYKTTAEKVTVTFDPCNGQDPKKFKVKIGSSLGKEIDAPANGSQRFLGWYNERNGSRSETAMAYKKDLRIWEDTTFYASWPFEVDENGVLYQVDKNGIGEELRIPANVRSIGENVFADCTQITSVFIPATVQEIQYNAFSGCTNIVSATAPGNLLSSFHYLQSAYVNGGSLTGSQSFSDSLKDLQISIYVTDIDLSNIRMNALERISVDFGNPNWTSNDGILYKASDKSIAYVPKAIKGAISILDGCTGIGRHAFYSSSGLQTVTIPSSVTSIGESAFYNCYRITRVNYLGDLKGWCEIDFGNGSANPLNATDDAKLYVKENGGDREVTGAINIPVGTTKIGAYAFYGLTGITSVTIPDSVTSIGSGAFEDCTGITKVVVSSLKGWCEIGFRSDYANPLYVASGKAKLYVNENSEEKEVTGELSIPVGTTKIGTYAFYGLTGISSVTIPESVQSIGDYAFYNCTGLQTVMIPNSETNIYDSAFSGCTNITTATMPYDALSHLPNKNSLNTVTITSGDIPREAFKNRTNLQTVTIESGSIGSYAFQDCKGLQTVTIESGSIGGSAFYNCTGLQTVTIGSGVTSIGGSAFWGCKGITKVVISSIKSWCEIKFGDSNANPLYVSNNAKSGTAKLYLQDEVLTEVKDLDGLNAVPEYAFYGCKNIASVTIPDSVISIGRSAFSGCTGIASVTIPDSVTSISNYAFSGCTGITKVVVSSLKGWCEIEFGDIYANPLYVSNHAKSGKAKLYVQENGEEKEITGEVNIPTDITKISDSLFYGLTAITSVTMLDSVTSIGDYAFQNCTGLQTVTIGNGVTSIGDYAFADCTSLSDITITDNVTSIGRDAFANTLFYNNLQDEVIYFGNIAYGYKGTNYPADGTIDIRPGTKSIISGAFNKCEWLKKIIIPDSVTSIGSSAFDGCTGLQTVTIGNGVTSIGNWAFSGCRGITRINYIGDLKGWCEIEFGDSYANPLYYGNAKLYVKENGEEKEITGELIIPVGIEKIGAYAFSGHTGITSLTIPESVTSIGERAFYDCTGLQTVTIGTGVTSIGERAFCDCTGLLTVTIESGSIGSYAFQNCTGLQTVTIGEGVKSIGNNAFYDCTSITTVTLPANAISYIPKDNLNTVTITSGDIPNNAFKSCTGMQTVTLGSGVTSIGESAFYKCTGITRVNYLGNLKGWCEIGFRSDYANPLYVASGKAKLYVNENSEEKEVTGELSIPVGTTKIGTYAFYGLTGTTSVTIPDSVTSIGESAFYGCTGLNEILIPNSVTSIGSSAFSGCTGLQTITIGNGVTSIGSGAFQDCTGLQTITIGNGVTSIGSGAFQDCTGLQTVTIESGSIGYEAFYDCTGLQTVTIGTGVTSIGEKAFYNCTGLKDIYYAGSAEQWGQIIKGNRWNRYYSHGYDEAINYQMHYNSTGPSAAASAEDAEYDGIARLFEEVEALRCTDEGKHAIAA